MNVALLVIVLAALYCLTMGLYCVASVWFVHIGSFYTWYAGIVCLAIAILTWRNRE